MNKNILLYINCIYC